MEYTKIVILIIILFRFITLLFITHNNKVYGTKEIAGKTNQILIIALTYFWLLGHFLRYFYTFLASIQFQFRIQTGKPRLLYEQVPRYQKGSSS